MLYSFTKTARFHSRRIILYYLCYADAINSMISPPLWIPAARHRSDTAPSMILLDSTTFLIIDRHAHLRPTPISSKAPSKGTRLASGSGKAGRKCRSQGHWCQLRRIKIQGLAHTKCPPRSQKLLFLSMENRTRRTKRRWESQGLAPIPSHSASTRKAPTSLQNIRIAASGISASWMIEGASIWTRFQGQEPTTPPKPISPLKENMLFPEWETV